MTRETFFISHGTPTLSVNGGLAARHFLKSWKEKVYPHTPNSILVISAHWETDVPAVNAISPPKVNDTIHDFYDFPEPMYQLRYPAPGAPQLAMRVKDLLLASGLDRVDEDNERGLDHGARVPLMLMYPKAEIPVCQLSVQTQKDATYHYNLGRALAPLKDEGVLIFGSGSATHNLRALSYTNETLVPWAIDFDTWLRHALEEGRYEDVNEYLQKAPCAKIAHPRPEHFYPLHVAIGAAGDDAKAKLIHHSWTNGCLSHASYQFTSTN